MTAETEDWEPGQAEPADEQKPADLKVLADAWDNKGKIGPLGRAFALAGCFGRSIKGPVPNAPRLAQKLAELYPVATGGQRIHVYRDGAYRPDEKYLERLLVDILGPLWKRAIRDEVFAFLRVSSPDLWQPTEEHRAELLGTVNVANGLLDTRTRQIGEHTAAFLWPIQLPAVYDPAATCPAVDRFLGQVVPTDVVPVVHEIAGLLMVPEMSYQLAVLLLGGQGTGKSTMLALLSAHVGRDHISTVPLQTLTEDRFAASQLHGKLANVCGDLDAAQVKQTGKFKQITGGDPIRLERKYHDAETAWLYARLIFAANQAPPTPDNSDAYRVRWLTVLMEQRFRGTRQEDRDLIAKLTTPAELSGFLNHALDGLDRLRTHNGFTRTDATRRGDDTFREQSDPLAAFIDERCALDPEAWIATRDLYDTWTEWTKRGNHGPAGTQKALTARLLDAYPDHLQYGQDPSGTARAVRGIGWAA